MDEIHVIAVMAVILARHPGMPLDKTRELAIEFLDSTPDGSSADIVAYLDNVISGTFS